MGRISSINTGFWTSPQVVDNFTPEERYVYPHQSLRVL